jgi:regulator of protease activity HflC (stomatin/prohibitin superfamily)
MDAREVHSLLGVLMAIGGILVTLFKSVSFVQEGERGVKLRFGKVVRTADDKPYIVEPGWVWMIPYVEKLKRRHVRQQTLPFKRQRILIKDGLTFEISAIVIFRVTNVYKALFEIDNLDDSITDICMGVLRDEIQTKAYTELSDTAAISKQLLEHVQQQAKDWGVEFSQFRLTDCAPSAETAHLLNVKIGARLKVEALQEIAPRLPKVLAHLNPSLAAVLVGAPLAAAASSTASDSPVSPETKETGEKDNTVRDGVLDAIDRLA